MPTAPNSHPNEIQIGTVPSADGTEIRYRRQGSGPGLVLVQGSMGTAENFRELSAELAPHFDVVSPDRRGRGLSGPGGSTYALACEIEDLHAVLTATGARFVFGLSTGAVIALWAGRRLPAVEKLAAYEPVLFPDRQSLPRRELQAFEQAIAAGRIPAALVAGMKAGGFAPAALRLLPDRVLAWLVGLGLRREAKQPPTAYTPMSELAHSLRNDFALVEEVAGRVDDLADVEHPVLLMGGSRSPGSLRRGLALAATTLPHATTVQLAGLGHGAAWNADLRGTPRQVAAELAAFFTSPER
jgi:pimeloyl-ACP methyl ester carboxylesterase